MCLWSVNSYWAVFGKQGMDEREGKRKFGTLGVRQRADLSISVTWKGTCAGRHGGFEETLCSSCFYDAPCMNIWLMSHALQGGNTVSKQRLRHHTRPRRSVIAQLPIEALIPADACLQIYLAPASKFHRWKKRNSVRGFVLRAIWIE